MTNEERDWVLANSAFEKMTLEERRLVLMIFARLQYPRVEDRFFEAVYQVVRGMPS